MSGFLRRWADRKAAPAEPRPNPTAKDAITPPPAIAAEDGALAVDSPTPEEIAAHLAQLPAVADIGADTDIRPFLRDFVPAALRKAAMRRAWAADPIISTHLDVARDYALDFNASELPVGFSVGLSEDAVKRSLDALGEIGQREPEAIPDLGDPPAPEEPPALAVESDATEFIAPQASASSELPPEPKQESQSSRSSLFVPPRHGSALPS